MTIAIAISDHILASKLLILILYNTFKVGESGSPFVQYIHVFTSQSKPRTRVYCNVFQICIFLQSLGKKAKRETEGDHFQNGERVLMKPAKTKMMIRALEILDLVGDY